MPVGIIVLVVAIVVASGLCSMYEAALLSISPIRVKSLYEDRVRHARDLLEIKENIHFFIATLVIINNAINICGAIFIGQMVARTYGDKWLGISSAFLTFAIIIISEIFPKSFGQYHRVAVALAGAKILKVIGIVINPVTKFIMLFIRFSPKGAKTTLVTEGDIKTMLKIAKETGQVEDDEEKICRMVFRLNDLKVKDIMKPIDELTGFYADKTLGDQKANIITCRYSRVAVFGKNKHDIIGICRNKDLLIEIANDNYQSLIKEFATRPIYVYEYEKSDEALYKFQMYHQHLFVVRNIVGENIGILTMEDVLEEIFGEIYDEKDVSEYRKIDKSLSDPA